MVFHRPSVGVGAKGMIAFTASSPPELKYPKQSAKLPFGKSAFGHQIIIPLTTVPWWPKRTPNKIYTNKVSKNMSIAFSVYLFGSFGVRNSVWH